ncbi:tRNA-uridine aminocarboxypropyltransferase [Alteromonas sp. HB246098]
MRLYCKKCGYPEATCICVHISTVNTSLNIIIIQHEKEAYHAKNTARLISLCIPTSRIVLTNDAQAMGSLPNECSLEHTALMYPSDTSMPIERTAPERLKQLSTLLLIDGSWKQAFGIVKQHPWLATLPTFHFSSAPTSNYAIRHTKLEHALSTLEATAYAISCLEKTDVSALHEAQCALQKHWRGPKSHRRQI